MKVTRTGQSFRWSRFGRPVRGAWTVLACAAALALAGCTSASPEQPLPSSGLSGSSVPQTRSGQGTGLIPPDSETGTATQSVATPSAASPPPPPEAATLTWLAGATPTDGVVLNTADGKRWQGQLTAGRALLGDDGYSWFGPDGSMVGCRASGACVGVDAQGRVAVTTGHGSSRLVYDARGHFLGRFSAKDKRLSRPSSPPSLKHAMASTGVDVPALVNEATLGAPFAGGATGDPHLITAGGTRVTTQSLGQFVARTGDSEHSIQLQFEPMAHREDVSVVSAVAIGAGSDTITVDMTGTLTINGTVRPRASGFDQVTLSSGVAVGRWPADSRRVVAVAVVWPDGGSVVMAANPALGMTVVAHLPPVASVSGLFGSGSAGSGSDLVARSGSSTSTDQVISSWKVPGSDRIFGSPPSTEPGFPTKTTSLDPVAEQLGQRSCRAKGLRDAEDVSACAFDVALTGDTGFVPGHVAMALSAEAGPIAEPFAKRWPALVTGSPGASSNLPSGGHLRFTLDSKRSRTFRITLDGDEAISFINRSGCGLGETPPGMDQPAMRVFDAQGRPVSDRFALCGHEHTSTLPAGRYHLVVANGPSSSALPVRVDVILG